MGRQAGLYPSRIPKNRRILFEKPAIDNCALVCRNTLIKPKTDGKKAFIEC